MGKVRAINVPKSAGPATVIIATAVDVTSETVAALTLHLCEETQNISEASRVIARAKFAGVDLSTVQRRCFDNNVSGTLMKKAFALSLDHTRESLAKADAAISQMQRDGEKLRREKAASAAREKREAIANAPLGVKMFANLTLG